MKALDFPWFRWKCCVIRSDGKPIVLGHAVDERHAIRLTSVLCGRSPSEFERTARAIRSGDAIYWWEPVHNDDGLDRRSVLQHAAQLRRMAGHMSSTK